MVVYFRGQKCHRQRKCEEKTQLMLEIIIPGKRINAL
jgi:hypothetical protein